MMKDNPVYSLSKRQLNQYRKSLSFYAKKTRHLLVKHKPSPSNQQFLRRWLDRIAYEISTETQKLLVKSIDEVIEKTINTYNKMHKGDKLTTSRIEELKLEIRKEFLLSKFKGATLDQRISHSHKRLRINLQKELQNLITGYANGSNTLENLINSITGKDHKEGGTAYRWNSRLVLSEMYRAYQFTGKVVLAELGVEKVEWVNSPRHEPKESLIDGYTEKVYTPSGLPEYPYPCNDSYFIPIY